MTRLEHVVIIDLGLAAIYARCKAVERYPEFLPGYVESNIIGQDGQRFLLQRAAKLKGELYRWTSWVTFSENHSLHFEQAEGPLQGMTVDWNFYAISHVRTSVVITHRFHIGRPFIWGFFLERFFFKPRIDSIAQQVVDALKRVCEGARAVTEGAALPEVLTA